MCAKEGGNLVFCFPMLLLLLLLLLSLLQLIFGDSEDASNGEVVCFVLVFSGEVWAVGIHHLLGLILKFVFVCYR